MRAYVALGRYDHLASSGVQTRGQESTQYLLTYTRIELRISAYFGPGVYPTLQEDAADSPMQTLAHALLNLTSHPQYLEPLREEVRDVTERYGWTKDSMGMLVRMESFLRESQRISGTSLCGSTF